MPASRSPRPGRWPVAFGTAELLADADQPGGWLLEVDGIPQSYVHLDDPGHLEFGYVQLLADLVDLAAPPGQPLRVLHLGGGGCTLARYVAHTRPGSPQLVLEADAPLAALVRRELGTGGFRLRVAEVRAALPALADGSSDVVLGDVFAGAALPVSCCTAEHLAEVARVLAPPGLYAVNVADGPGLAFARAEAATLAGTFPHLALLAEPGILRGRRFGNVVLAGSAAPFDGAALARRAARAAGTARLLLDEEVRRFAGGRRPLTDAGAAAAPSPPVALFARRADSRP